MEKKDQKSGITGKQHSGDQGKSKQSGNSFSSKGGDREDGQTPQAGEDTFGGKNSGEKSYKNTSKK